MKQGKIEILAPAGSFASLQAAINAGADAVYFGVEQLNMRSRAADNFTVEDLDEVARIIHQTGAKAYLTLNTLLYDHDLILMKKLVDTAIEKQMDGIIVADQAAILYAHKKGLPVHVSTQLSVSNIESVEFFAKYADVIVLARELDLRMIERIVKEIKERDIRGPSGKLVKIEVFAHGALCIAYSGRCGMSLFTDNASANRGACRQNCRKAYIVKDKETGIELELDNEFIMSPNDINTLPFLPELLATGVSVLKLEGRGRSPDYTDMIVRVYREAVDAVANRSFDEQKVENWMQRISTVYNRGFSDGYYLGREQGWSKTDGSVATEEKVFVGPVKHYFPKAGVIEIEIRAADLPLGSSVVIIGDITGVIRAEVSELRADDRTPISMALRKTVASFPVPEKVRTGDKVYLLKPRGISLSSFYDTLVARGDACD